MVMLETTNSKEEKKINLNKSQTAAKQQQQQQQQSSNSGSRVERQLFHKKLTQLLGETGNLGDNVWIINQLIIPLDSSATLDYNPSVYLVPEDEQSIYNHLIKKNKIPARNLSNENGDTSDSSVNSSSSHSNKNETIDNEPDSHLSLPAPRLSTKESKTRRPLGNNVHTMFAFNINGHLTLPPLVIFPQMNEPLLSNLEDKPVQHTCQLEESMDGDLNNVGFIVNWLKKIASAKPKLAKNEPIVLILNSFIHKTFGSDLKQVAEICEQENIYLLFYPIQTQDDLFNRHMFAKFKETWSTVHSLYSQINNPNTKLAFLYMYRQVLRQMIKSKQIVNKCFHDLFQMYPVDDGIDVSALLTSDLVPSSSGSSSSSSNNDDEYYEEEDCLANSATFATTACQLNNNKDSGSTSSKDGGIASLPKLTDKETHEIIEWMDEMSQTGCLCIKHTFIFELYVMKLQKYNSSSYIQGEKKWAEFCSKNKGKFKQDNCLISENDYMNKWFDEDHWHTAYYNFMHPTPKKSRFGSSDSIWTFDIIQFPYVATSGLIKAPEKDQSRPKNAKPRISVIFCFNASGDYLPPYFIYPLNFEKPAEVKIEQINEEAANPTSTALTELDEPANESSNDWCYSPNGFLTCRIFEQWLHKSFLPFLKQKELVTKKKLDYLLLYCAKLPVIDAINYSICKDPNNRISLFTLTQNESSRPFTFLFQKELRKRKVDLFLDSWRKVTASSNVSYQFKCKSRSQFFNLFTDAFQNCIEEIGNGKELNATPSCSDTAKLNDSNQAVEEFKNKMIMSFESSLLWPVNHKDYKPFIDNWAKKLAGENPAAKEDVVIEQPKDNNNQLVANTEAQKEKTARRKSLMPVKAEPKEAPVKQEVQENALNDSYSFTEEADEPFKRKLSKKAAEPTKATKRLKKSSESANKSMQQTTSDKLDNLSTNIKLSIQKCIKEELASDLRSFIQKESDTAAGEVDRNSHKELVRDLLEMILSDKLENNQSLSRLSSKNLEYTKELLSKTINSGTTLSQKSLNDLAESLCDHYSKN